MFWQKQDSSKTTLATTPINNVSSGIRRSSSASGSNQPWPTSDKSTLPVVRSSQTSAKSSWPSIFCTRKLCGSKVSERVAEFKSASNSVANPPHHNSTSDTSSAKHDNTPRRAEGCVQPVSRHTQPPLQKLTRSAPIKMKKQHHLAIVVQNTIDPSGTIFLPSGELAAFQLNEFDEVMPAIPWQIRPPGEEPMWNGRWEESARRRSRNIMPVGIEVCGVPVFCRSAKQFVIVVPGTEEK